MRATYFGVRGSCPCSSDQHRRYGGNTSCVLVEVDGEPPLIIDLGTGLRALGNHLQAPLEVIDTPLQATVLLTHLHYDHILGLPFFSPLRHPDSVLDMYGPSQEATTLHDQLDALVRPPYFPIRLGDFGGKLRFHDLDGSDDFTIGGIKVKARSIPHRGHTLGFRLEAEGRVLAYVSDHQAPADLRTVDRNVLELCDGADLVLHDAQYTEEEFRTASDWGHSTANFAVRVARASGASRLSLFHHDPAHTDREIDQMLLAAQQMASEPPMVEVTAAAEGTSIDLGKASA